MLRNGYMNYICDKCGGSNIVVDNKQPEPQPVKMSEVSSVQWVPLVYKLTTLRCTDCNYKVDY